MYLKRLEMLGFKSFATRTGLEFSTGITAVVGPNGAGKSNVADAVRWVLGEQSMRQLRGKKSEDIIFAGGHGKAALGMAEVSLTLDNSTGWVPSEYSEIVVTRRSYRSGENEYLINKQKVRLRDVVLLLAQARIGHDSYTVVGQGLIDAALSLRAEERRGLFEDAAGIRPYQVQRADAENRLRQTEQNLDRLRDIVSEIEPRLEPLAEQARRAVESMQLNSQLQEVLLTWYALQWRRLRAAKEQSEEAEQEMTRNVRKMEESVQATEERRELLRLKRQEAQIAITRAREATNEANAAAGRIEREMAVSQERIVGLERQQEEQRLEEQRLRERLVDAQRRLIDLEEQCDLADEAIDNDAAALATREGQVAKAQKEFDMDERRLSSVRSEYIQVQARLGASQSDLGRQQKHLGERNRALAARRDTIAQSQQTIRALETRLLDERARLDTARQEEQHITQRRQGISRAISDAQQEMERFKQSLSEAERQRRAVSDRLNMLNNWRSSLSGYSDGVRALLRVPSGKLSGLLGPVPQLGVAPAGLESALEAALGPYLQAVVTQSYEDARLCLDYLRQNKAGRAMLVWLEGASGEQDERAAAEAASLDALLAKLPQARASVKGLAWRLMQCDARYVPLFQRLLRGIVVVVDLETARTLLNHLQQPVGTRVDVARMGGPLWASSLQSFVTLQGEVLHAHGWLTGGGQKEGGQQGLLAYERELRELPRQLDEHVALIHSLNGMISEVQRGLACQLDEHVALIHSLNGMISEVQRGLEARRIEQSAVDKELSKNASVINECNKALNTTQRELDRLQVELQSVQSLEQQLSAELAGLEQEVQAAIERVKAHEKSQREQAGLVEELQREVEERTLVFRRQQDELGRARTALAVKRQEAKSLRQQLATGQTAVQDLKAQIEQRAARMQEAQAQISSLRVAIASSQTQLEQAQGRARTLTGELRQAEEKASELDLQILAVEQETLQLRQKLNELEVAYRRCLLDSQKARDALEALLQQLQEEMGVTDPGELARYAARSDLEQDGDEESSAGEQAQAASPDEPAELSQEEEAQLRKLRRRVDSLRGRLKALGGSDPDAPRQYEETRTRFEFLTTQIADMDQAALHLRTIIAQLDATMARQFESTFEAVNARFREHFTTLFNGGHARLELLPAKSEDNGDAPVEASAMPAGVEVIVQPPGKKVQDLALLSGGERALVSAALLFALLEINPPPFCLLDEVDAALDESNVARFCEILKRLAHSTQFIVITHNRVTMMAAQVIYGVSMGGDSVSRLLSMKLEEVPVGDR